MVTISKYVQVEEQVYSMEGIMERDAAGYEGSAEAMEREVTEGSRAEAVESRLAGREEGAGIMEREDFIKDMLCLLPYWHYKIDKPFKLFIKDRMSLETYYCLEMLRQKGPMTMTEICHYLKISKQQATKMIETLHEYHFIERQANEEDRRFITICVTERAIRYIENNIYKNQAFQTQLKEKLEERDLKRLEWAIETLLEILPKLD